MENILGRTRINTIPIPQNTCSINNNEKTQRTTTTTKSTTPATPTTFQTTTKPTTPTTTPTTTQHTTTPTPPTTTKTNMTPQHPLICMNDSIKKTSIILFPAGQAAGHLYEIVSNWGGVAVSAQRVSTTTGKS
jgi:hypothetical protein